MYSIEYRPSTQFGVEGIRAAGPGNETHDHSYFQKFIHGPEPLPDAERFHELRDEPKD
jgi:arginase family enzyme